MRRLTLLVAAAAARPENATAYFDAASRLWPPTSDRVAASRRELRGGARAEASHRRAATAGDVCVIGLALSFTIVLTRSEGRTPI